MSAGGSEAPAMALLEMLQDKHTVTLLTGGRFECDRLNRAYDTRVISDRISVAVAPIPAFLRSLQAGDALRGAYISRFTRRISSDFDLCISTYNFAPFRNTAVHFVADFSWDEGYRLEHDPLVGGLRGLVQRPGLLRGAYRATVGAISGGHEGPPVARGDTVVANSQWSADLLQSRHGITSQIIYPPVNAAIYDPNAPRTGDFVMLGRISPDKRIEEAIALLSRVRALGHRFNFQIIGPLDTSPYSTKLRSIAKEAGDWVRLRGGMYGTAKFSELARHSYAIHVRAREAFGIAVAEQVKMGLIPFVPARTAPVEIVREASLCFESQEHAVKLIDQVLRSDGQRQNILSALSAHAANFSKERFIQQTRTLLDVIIPASLNRANCSAR